MRNFFLLAHDPDPRLASISEFDVCGYDFKSLLVGEGLKAPLPIGLKLVYDDSKEWVDYMNSALSWRLFSPRLRDLIGRYMQPTDSFVQLALTPKSGHGERLCFWLGVFQTVVECLDRENSVYRQRPDGHLASVSRLCVLEDVVPSSVHIFLVKEFPFYLVIDEEVKNSLVSSGLVGFRFVDCASSLAGVRQRKSNNIEAL